MKTLYLIRHAKSSWSDPGCADFDRPLNKRGKRDAPFMGRRMNNVAAQPELILSSPAKRASRTARIIAGEIGYDKKAIEYRSEIYSADLQDLLDVIRGTDNSISALCLVGHNYVITDCGDWLTGKRLVNIPTCGIVAISFEKTSWEEIGSEDGRLLFFDYPKLHGNRSERG